MSAVYRLRRHRPRVPRRAVLAVAGAGLAAWVTIGAATMHMPAQPPAPAAVTVTADAPTAAASPAAAKAAKSHHVAAGLLAVHRLLPHGGYHRPFWRIRRWFR